MDRGYIPGLMARDMKVAGRTASNMGRLRLPILRAKAKLEFGKTETESNGLVQPQKKMEINPIFDI